MRDRGDGGVEILDNRALQVLRLKSFTDPAAGGGAVIAESTADAIVITGTGEQGIDLLHRRLSTAEPQLEHPLHRRRQLLCVRQLPLDRPLSSFCSVQSCCCSHASSRASG